MVKYLREISELNSCRQLIDNQTEKFFTENELKTYGNENGLRSLSARYILKRKLLTELNQLCDFTDIEIMNDDYGKPLVSFKNKANTLNKVYGIKCSLSHSRNYIAILIAIETHE